MGQERTNYCILNFLPKKATQCLVGFFFFPEESTFKNTSPTHMTGDKKGYQFRVGNGFSACLGSGVSSFTSWPYNLGSLLQQWCQWQKEMFYDIYVKPQWKKHTIDLQGAETKLTYAVEQLHTFQKYYLVCYQALVEIKGLIM